MKYKVGDFVEYKAGNHHGKGEVLEEESDINKCHVRLKTGGTGYYVEHQLSPATPTLDNMPSGTVVENGAYEKRKVLHALKAGLYVMSGTDNFDETDEHEIWTTKDLNGYKIKDQEDTVEIEIEGNTKSISRRSAEELNLI